MTEAEVTQPDFPLSIKEGDSFTRAQDFSNINSISDRKLENPQISA